MTPRQARAARALLALDMKTVCLLANVGKRTLAEFESGNRRINNATENKIKAFYISRGLYFLTPECGEGVAFAERYKTKSKPPQQRKEKSEYVDLFSIQDTIEKIVAIREVQDLLRSQFTISQLIIHSVLKKSGRNQKEIAALLECTPAFINAVAVGKKSLPVIYAEKLKGFFESDNINIATAIRQEKVIRKLLVQSMQINEAQLTAWCAILP